MRKRVTSRSTSTGSSFSFHQPILSFTREGYLRLQPIEASSDGKSLKLGFYWLDKRQTERSAEMVDLMDSVYIYHSPVSRR